MRHIRGWGFAFVLVAKTLRSTTFKLALISIGVFGAVAIALFGYVYWSTTTFVLSRSDSVIEAEQAMLRNIYDTSGRDGLVRAIDQHKAAAHLGGEGFICLATSHLSPSPAILKNGHLLSVVRTENGVSLNISGIGSKGRYQSVAIQGKMGNASGRLSSLGGQRYQRFRPFSDKMYAALAFAILLILVLAAVASVSVTRRTVGRIESINATSRSIMERGLGRRIPLRGTQDEWDHLAQNLNSMLERIEGLMAEVKQVSDNVAHDLRTPLTRMRGRLEKASIEKSASDRDQSLINKMIADLDDVLRMFSSLTRISQIEATNQKVAFRTVNLLEIAVAVGDLFDASAESKGRDVEVIGGANYNIGADRDLLFDAISNLVDNAIKHGPEGGVVIVSVEQKDGGAVLSIADEGPGIPPDEVERVHNRSIGWSEAARRPAMDLASVWSRLLSVSMALASRY